MELPFWGVADALEFGRLLPKAGIPQHGASALDVVTLVILTAFDVLVLVEKSKASGDMGPSSEAAIY